MRRSTLRLYRRQAGFMDKRKPLRIDNSFSPDFMEFICWTSHVSRGVACCASIPARQEKTAENTINIFVILLIIIWLCGITLWGAAALRLYRRKVSSMDKRKMGIDYSPLNMPNARLIFNSPFSIFNLRSCPFNWPRSGER